jgi:hypothetical protein
MRGHGRRLVTGFQWLERSREGKPRRRATTLQSAGDISMPTKKPAAQPHIQYHKDGSVWAKGQTLDGVPTGYWEWFRKGGVRMRSGYFEKGEQVGQWTTYDGNGVVYKVTTMKPKAK